MRLKLPLRIITLVCAASLLAYACGDSTSPLEGKPVSLTLLPSEFTLNAIGDTKDLTATVYDALGNVIDTTVLFEPSDQAIVTVTTTGRVTATGVGVASVTASLGSLTKTSEINVFPVGTDVQIVSGDLQSAVVGTALPDPLVVQVSDPGNNPVPGIEVSFTVVSGGGSLTVESATTDASGRASTVLTLGTRSGPINTVAVLAGGVGSTQFVATGLADVPQDAQVLTGDGQIQPVGTTLPIDLAVLVRDQFDNGVPGQDVNYAVLIGGGSITPATVQTDADGVARAQWTLGGTLGTQTAEADVPVLSVTPAFSAEATDLSVTAVTPDTLVEGQPAQITGTGFEAVISNVTVTVDGVAAQVTGATTTTIDIVVPKTQCLPARDVMVTVTTTTGGTTPAGAKPVKPGAFVSMAVGEMALLQDPSDFCFQFEQDPTVRSYLLGVQSAATAGSGLTGASVLGVVQGPGPGLSTVMPNVDFTASQGFVPAGLDERVERWRRHREAEAGARVADLELAESIMRSGIDFASAAAGQLVDSTVTVGQSVSFRVPKLAGSCTDFTTITATVKAVGLRGIWLRDNANLGPGFLDTDYQDLSDQLDNFIFDVDTSYFGEPTDLDRNARIVVLVTQQLNEDNPNLLGFVTSSDFFPLSTCRRSNFAEVYYAKAPGQGYPRANALSDAPVLIAHELTHIIQFGRRLVVRQGQFMAAFMAEGQATMAEEVVGHAALGNAPGGNFGYNVAFDLSGMDPNDWYFLPFFDISFFYGRVFSGPKVANAPHACSWLTANPAPCGSRALWYGVTWSLLRWVSDHFGPGFPGGEQAIQKALVDSDLRGLESIEDVIGVPIETFLAEWAATLYLDDRGVAGLPARLDFPSWNLLNIYEGGNLPSSAKLDPIRIVFTNFARNVDVRAASTAYFVLAGDVQSPTAVRVRDQADGQLPPNMQVFIVRIF